MSRLINIGTRKSKLALWQANEVKRQLEALNVQCKIIPITSQGDNIQDKAIHKLGITGVFTRELDVALINEEIDIAVHSMKDVPTTLPKGIVQSAVLERFNSSDTLVLKKEQTFNIDSDVTIATGSLRRKAQWLNKYPNSRVVGLRGNIETRLKKIDKSNWLGGILARAGLDRLGINPATSMNLTWMVPAPAQGVIMICARKNDDFANKVCSSLNHRETELCSSIERNFLKTLEGGCTAPIGGVAKINEKLGSIDFKGVLLSRDGKKKISVQMSCGLQSYSNIGEKSANDIISRGGKELIQRDIEIESKFSIFSTKKLSEVQKKQIPKTVFLGDSDFININYLDIPKDILNKPIKNVIITSKNAVESILTSSRGLKLKFENIFCVGEKTKSIIEKNIGKVNFWKRNSEDLALEIIKRFPDERAIYFCGNKRLNTLPSLLKKNHIVLEEVISYSTSSNSSVLNYDFSAIMFFSPSSVQSFLEKNEPGAVAFCLGKETAIEARKYFNDVQVANSPDFESLIKLIERNLNKV